MTKTIKILGGLNDGEIYELARFIEIYEMPELIIPDMKEFLTDSRCMPHIRLHRWMDTDLINEEGHIIFLYIGYRVVER